MFDSQQISINGVALAHGGILALFIYIGYEISGSHYNPSISIAMFLLGKEKFLDMMMYCTCQLAGGMVASAFISFNISIGHINNSMKTNNSVLGYPNTKEDIGRMQAVLGELIGTLTLIIVVLIANEKSQYKPERKGNYALCIGLVLTCSIYAIGPISGAALNPARFFGPMIVSGTLQTVTTPYLAGGLVGTVVAVFFYKTF